MVFREYLRQSVCALCTCAAVSFILIFIVSIALIESLRNEIKSFTPITLYNYTRWGEIPGSLNYEYTKELYLYNLTDDDITDSSIYLGSVGPITLNVNRQFTDPIYDNAKMLVNYTMEHSYSVQQSPEGLDLDQKNFKMLNMEAESLWY